MELNAKLDKLRNKHRIEHPNEIYNKRETTGGELNGLNGWVSAPENSVPVIDLINAHNPHSHDELEALIEYHFLNRCECGIVSKGTVQDFGRNLYEKQFKEWKEYRYTLEQCIRWEYLLFVVNSLDGARCENNAIGILNAKLPNEYATQKTTGAEDANSRVDVLIIKNNEVICGVQVKPDSFLRARQSVKDYQYNANLEWGKPVYHMYYDEDTKLFINTNSVLNQIINQ